MNLTINKTHTDVKEPADYNSGTGVRPIRTVTISAELAGLRLDQALARVFSEYSRSCLQGWLRAGHIRVDGKQLDVRHKVWGGEQVALREPVATHLQAEQAEEIALQVLFEDEQILVINKPAGLVVHPGNGNWSGTLLNALLHHAPEVAALPRAGIVHRLDKDTTGLLVVAKTLLAQTDLVRQLQARTVSRHYLALVHGTVSRDGVVDAPIGRHPVQRTRMAVNGQGKPARTHYRIRSALDRATLLECQLETGRTHQIRVHMAHIGHPLVGDPVYGARRISGVPLMDAFPRQALHAFSLGLQHPVTGESLLWSIPVAEDFAVLLSQLGVEVPA